MTKLKDDYNIKDIINNFKKYSNEKTDVIEKAFNYVKDKVNSITLKHLLNVSYILTEINSSSETIIPCILSYLYDDKNIKLSMVEEAFGENIARVSLNIYKLENISLSTENDYLVEYYKKVIVGMTEDVRVIIVTLADRVYLMRKLPNKDPLEQKKIAKETSEIFAPLAHHLGIYKLKSELEDLSLRYLKPEVFYDIVEKLNSTKKERDNIINEMMMEVSNLLKEHNVIFDIKGRSKSIYSIYNKLDKGRKFSDIYDLLALRILVKKDEDCYLVLGLIHSKFKPIAKRFKDFIAMPKSNGYESLHTTVFGVNNELFEIQIRTYEMNDIAENGVAAHWSYKEHKEAYHLSKTDAKLEFFKAIIDTSKEGNKDISTLIKEENNPDNIYVFTPKGDVIELPLGSTPVDFAYRVHTKIGEEMVGALVNNQIVPLNYLLQDGDVIKINTSKLSTGPKEDWLNFVKLTQTKNKIKAFFARNRKEEIITKGRELLEKELRRKKIGFNDFLTDSNIKKITKELKVKDLDHIYLEIGNNNYTPQSIINIIYEEESSKEIIPKIIKNELDVNVAGENHVKVNIASCCLPLPGDDIIGYITKNNGITVHRKNCSNLIHLEDRIIDVKFNEITKNKYLTNILIILKNNQNRLGDILNKMTSKNIVIESIHTLYKDNIISYKISLYINNLKSLNNLLNDLNKIRYVKESRRV